MALPAKSLSLKINFKKLQVFIFSKEIYTIVKYTKSFEKKSSQSFIFHQNLKVTAGVSGFRKSPLCGDQKLSLSLSNL